MSAHARLRLPIRRASLLAAGVLAATVCMLLASSAGAAARRDSRAASHRPIVKRQCVSKSRNGSSRGAARRAKRASGAPCPRPPARHPSSGGSSAGSLQATPLYGTGTGAAPQLPSGGEQGSRSQPPSPGRHTAGSPEKPAGGAPEKPAGGHPGNFTGNLPIETGEEVKDPIDSRFLTGVPFGMRSFWIQPWRAYLDTWPASRLLDSVGINFNVSAANAEATAQLLQSAGFKLARMGISWSALSYDDPTRFIPFHLTKIAARLTALHNHGLRPLIVLQAYSGAPTPEKNVVLETTTEAPAGAHTVTLTPTSAAAVVPGKTGFDELPAGFKGSPNILITSVSAGGVATLSRPLLSPLPAGPHGGTTLLYAPFGPPKLANGQPNPEFQATLDGWLKYVAAVSDEAASIVGPGGFDLEIWNELTFGSAFLNSERYYGGPEEPAPAPASAAAAGPSSAAAAAPAEGSSGAAEQAGASEGESSVATPGSEAEEGGPEASYNSEADPGSETGGPEVEEGPEEAGASAEEPAPSAAVTARAAAAKPHKKIVSKEIRKALLNETVAYVRNPANGISANVGITNGFASQTPFPSGAGAPLGLTALSKHPYVGARHFPVDNKVQHIFPLDALGARDTAEKGSFTPLFVPTYQSLLPEYTLTATSTETLVRDIAPFTTNIYHFPHGRNVGPPGGGPVQKWVTEYNLIPGKATVMGPDGVTPQTGASATLTPADKRHFDAKVVLRSLVSMVNKGMSREYFFAAAPGALSLIDAGFFSALEEHPGEYPGDQLGGETMDSLRSMLAQFQGPGPSGDARQLKLLSIVQDGNHGQFSGDGTSAHPELHDRDVLAVLPFQSSPTHFAIPVYVMTRDLLTLYEPGASGSDVTRFDLPDEKFRITLGGLPEGATAPTISAYDPIRKTATPATLVSREGETAVVELSVVDYPRVLSIEYPG